MKIVSTILSFFLCFTALSVLAQQDSISVSYEDTTIKYAVVYKKLDSLETHKLTAYYKLDTSQIAFRKNYFYGKQSGVYKAFYPNGSRMIFSIYQLGKLNGDFSKYDSTGKLIEKYKYKNGLKNGYSVNVKEKSQGRYLDGEKHGKWEYEVGTPLYNKQFYDRGKKVEKRQVFLSLKKEKEISRLYEYEEKKQDTVVIHKGNQKLSYNATYISRDSIDHPTKRIAYFNDYPHQKAIVKYIYNGYVNGIYRIYYPNGFLYREAHYLGGLLDGDWKEYTSEGVLTIRGKYRNGKKHGKWEYGLRTNNYKKERYIEGKLKQ